MTTCKHCGKRIVIDTNTASVWRHDEPTPCFYWAEPSSAPVETQATRCSKCGGSTFSTQWGLCTCSLAQASESELPPIPKPLTKSKHWDDGIEWRIAVEAAGAVGAAGAAGAVGAVVAVCTIRAVFKTIECFLRRFFRVKILYGTFIAIIISQPFHCLSPFPIPCIGD